MLLPGLPPWLCRLVMYLLLMYPPALAPVFALHWLMLALPLDQQCLVWTLAQQQQQLYWIGFVQVLYLLRAMFMMWMPRPLDPLYQLRLLRLALLACQPPLGLLQGLVPGRPLRVLVV